jgi:hypothetical protein
MPTVVKRTRRAERAVQRRELRAVSVPDLLADPRPLAAERSTAVLMRALRRSPASWTCRWPPAPAPSRRDVTRASGVCVQQLIRPGGGRSRASEQNSLFNALMLKLTVKSLQLVH